MKIKLGLIEGLLPKPMFNRGVLSDKQKGYDKFLNEISNKEIEVSVCPNCWDQGIKDSCQGCSGSGVVVEAKS